MKRLQLRKPRQVNFNTELQASPDSNTTMASDSTSYSREDIAEAIKDKVKNSFARVIGLPSYFCRGGEKKVTPPRI